MVETMTTAEGQVFLKLIKDNMPEAITGAEVVQIMGTVVTTYSDGPEQAAFAVRALFTSLREYYMQEDTCDCPKCTGRRQKNLH